MGELQTAGALRRYVLFQLPGTALLATALWYGVEREWLSLLVATLILVAWVLKDALLYPALRTAYLPDENDPGAELRGKHGIARDALTEPDRAGYVKIGPELWRAVLDDNSGPVSAGDPVRVCTVRGLQLVVERIRD